MLMREAGKYEFREQIKPEGRKHCLPYSETTVTTLLSQISWSNHLAIVSKAKTVEERHFYMMLCIKENYSARELSRQILSAVVRRQITVCATVEIIDEYEEIVQEMIARKQGHLNSTILTPLINAIEIMGPVTRIKI